MKIKRNWLRETKIYKFFDIIELKLMENLLLFYTDYENLKIIKKKYHKNIYKIIKNIEFNDFNDFDIDLKYLSIEFNDSKNYLTYDLTKMKISNIFDISIKNNINEIIIIENFIFLFDLNKNKYLVYNLNNLNKINLKGIKINEYIIKHVIMEDFILIVLDNNICIIYEKLTMNKINFKGFNNRNITNASIENNYLIININDKLMLYDKKNLSKIKFNDLEINDFIAEICVYEKYIFISKNKLNNWFIYDKIKFNCFKLKDISKNDCIVDFRITDNFILISKNINNNWLWYNKKNLKKINFKNIRRIYEICQGEDFFINKINFDTNWHFYYKKNFKKIKFEKIMITDIIYDYFLFKDVISLSINQPNNYYIYNKTNLKLINFKNSKDDIIIRFKQLENVFYLSINSFDNSWLINKSDLKQTVLEGFTNNDKIFGAMIIEEFLLVEVKKRWIAYNKLTLEKYEFEGVCENDLIIKFTFTKPIIIIDVNSVNNLFFYRLKKNNKLIKLNLDLNITKIHQHLIFPKFNLFILDTEKKLIFYNLKFLKKIKFENLKCWIEKFFIREDKIEIIDENDVSIWYDINSLKLSKNMY